MDFQCLIYERKEPICYLTLNRPEKLKALNGTLMAEFREALDTFEADPDIRVVILTGAGRAFSAGFNFQREECDKKPQETQPNQWREQIKGDIDTFLKVWHISKPRTARWIRGTPSSKACKPAETIAEAISVNR